MKNCRCELSGWTELDLRRKSFLCVHYAMEYANDGAQNERGEYGSDLRSPGSGSAACFRGCMQTDLVGVGCMQSRMGAPLGSSRKHASEAVSPVLGLERGL
jgi:hypothetical protein